MTFLLALLLSLAGAAPDSSATPPGPPTVALTNARIETVTRGVVERGTLVIADGRIVALGADVAVPAGARVVDCDGLTLYPGLIDAGTRLGLLEIGSLDETRDYGTIGALTPQMDALTAVNPSSVLIPVTRAAGVTTVLTAPGGGMMPGTAALIHLYGYTPAHYDAGFRGVVLNFPSRARRSRRDARPAETIKKEYDEALEKLNAFWRQAETYARIDSAYRAQPEPARAPAYAPELAALLPVLRGEAPLLVEANATTDIEAALEWLGMRDVRAVLTGVAEGWRVAGKIKASGLPVIAGPVLAEPVRESDRYDAAYRNAGRLAAAGVPLALRTNETENVRNLPFHAGFAAAYGLGREAALAAVTIAPARIFGVAAEIGSLEVGKRATLFAADGDPFEPKTQVRHLYIDGYAVPLDNRQRDLYDEYLHRSPGLAE